MIACWNERYLLMQTIDFQFDVNNHFFVSMTLYPKAYVS